MMEAAREPGCGGARAAGRGLVGGAVSLVLLWMLPPAHGQAVEFDARERKAIARLSPLPPPPPSATNRFADDPAAARFGQALFFDPRLSVGERVSCATCHDPALAFTDGKPLAVGLETGTRNTPTLYNGGHQRWYFWDGRCDTLWSQTLGPLERDVEMGSTRVGLLHRIAGDAGHRAAYESIFGPLPATDELPPHATPKTTNPYWLAAWEHLPAERRDAINRFFANIGKALAAYLRKLNTPPAPFDTFATGLRDGDPDKLTALSPAAQRGLKLFIGRGNCRLCHNGPNFSDGEFHSIFVPPREGLAPDAGRYVGLARLKSDPFNAAGAYSDAPDGAEAKLLGFVANRTENYGTYKTPSLRNVARTAPYMHQGQFESLERVVHYYSTLEGAVQAGHHAQETLLVPLNLTEQEQADLIAFLRSLNSPDVDEALRK